MKHITLLLVLFGLHTSTINAQKLSTKTEYQCLPCGYDCDKAVYTTGEGTCKSCNMRLVAKSTIKFKNIEASAICAYIKTHPNTVLIDVRTPEEFTGKADPNFGTLKKAINYPIQTISADMKDLMVYKDKAILVFCSHSHRSPQVAYMLTQNGFTNVTNMNGGMSVVTSGSCIQK